VAVSAAEGAERALHGLPQALDTLGWMYHLTGRTTDAITYLTAARDKTPANPIYHYHLGAAYLSAGSTKEGRSSLAKALQISTSFDGAEDARRLLTP